MRVTLRVLPWDFSPATLRERFVSFREDWGIDQISFVINDPAPAVLLPNAEKGRLVFLEEGAICFLPEQSRFIDLSFLPPVSSACDGRNWLKVLVGTAKEVGLRVSIVLLCCKNPALGRGHPDLTVQNAFGDRLLHALCPANPTVRQLLVSLVRDLVTNYPVDAVELESIGYLSVSRFTALLTNIHMTPAIDFLFSLCFCPHCQQRAKAREIEMDRLCFFTRMQLEQFFSSPTDFGQMPLEWDSWAPLVDGEMGKLLHLRMDIVSELLGALVEEASHKHEKWVQVEGHLLPATLWQQGVDRLRLVELADAIEVDAKEVPPERLAPYLVLNRQVVRDRAELWVRFYPSERFVTSKQAFLAQARACREQGVNGVIIAGYGSLRRERWGWIWEAIRILKG